MKTQLIAAVPTVAIVLVNVKRELSFPFVSFFNSNLRADDVELQ
jgi:hypothetical protein